jgi:hypothetical protein
MIRAPAEVERSISSVTGEKPKAQSLKPKAYVKRAVGSSKCT